MGNDASKRKPVGLSIQRIGIDDVAQAKDNDASGSGAKSNKKPVVLSMGQEVTKHNVCELLQQLARDRAAKTLAGEQEGGSGSGGAKGKKKKAKKVVQDYDLCLQFLGRELVVLLKDKELREGVLDLDAEALGALMKSDELVVPDESYVLLTLGAWAERRAYSEEPRVEGEDNAPEGKDGSDVPAPSSGAGAAGGDAAVNMRGSDGLFHALGEGVAKLLVPKGESGAQSAVTSTEEKKEAEQEAEQEKEKEDGSEAAATTTSGEEEKTGESASDDKKPEGSSALTQSEKELQVNLRGTAGLYASFAGAYVNMISDEDMARQLQDEEEEAAKVRRKLMEEEDEKLARALQEAMTDDDNHPTTNSATATTGPAEEEEQEEDLEPIPDYKLTPEYIERIKKHMRPFLEHIRFSMLPLHILNTLANEQLAPSQYLTEAYKYHMLMAADALDLVDKNNVRYKRRRYISSVLWDSSWHGQHVQITGNGKVATKTQASWYSVACSSVGFQNGRHFWAVKVEGDECYIGITQKGNTQMDNYLGGNPQSWAFRSAYKYSSNHGNGFYGEAFGRGDVIGMLLDMDTGSLTYFKNGKNLGVCFTGLPRNEKLYPAVGWRAGTMTLVDLDTSLYPSDVISSVLG